MEVSVVIPVYNEVESVDLLCEKVHKVMSSQERSYEIILVDDGSTDGSTQRLKELCQQYTSMKVIFFRRNYGQTAAMSAGFKHADGDLIVTIDADLQNDPKDIPMLLNEVTNEIDVVSGWRKERKDKFFSRRLPSMIANSFISFITGVHLRDYGCTLKVYRKEVIKNISLYGEMHRFIPALASWAGRGIKEVVVNHHPRKFGQSKYGLSRTTKVILDLITVKFLLQYSKSPIQIFGKLAGLFIIPGIFLLFYVAIGNKFFDSGLIKRPFWVITPFMMIFFGIQFISMGLLAEIQIRTYHESQDKPIYIIREIIESP